MYKHKLRVGEALDLLRVVVRDKKDQTALCSYGERQEDGTYVPECIVGGVYDLLEKKYAIEGLLKNATQQSGQVDHNIERLEELGLLTATKKAKFILRVAQAVQDNGYTWGAALVAAEASYNMLTED